MSTKILTSKSQDGLLGSIANPSVESLPLTQKNSNRQNGANTNPNSTPPLQAPFQAHRPGGAGTSSYAHSTPLTRLCQNKVALLSIGFLIFVVLACFGSPLFVKHAWDTIEFVTEALPPSAEHWFGTDEMGRDLFSRVLYGGRVSLLVGIIATTVSVFIGVTYGAVAGYCGGKLDAWMMRLVDLLYSLPYYFIIVVIMVFFSISSIYFLFIILALFQWLGMARIVRGQVLTLKEREFVVALHACGATNTRIVLKHLIPNCMGVIAVYTTLTVPGIMLQEAFLSFIGISFQAAGSDGVAKPVASWGSLISEGARNFENAWWMLLFPSLFFSLTLLAINFLGDGLRDAFDPKMKV